MLVCNPKNLGEFKALFSQVGTTIFYFSCATGLVHRNCIGGSILELRSRGIGRIHEVEVGDP